MSSSPAMVRLNDRDRVKLYAIGLILIIPLLGDILAWVGYVSHMLGDIVAKSRHKTIDLLILALLVFLFIPGAILVGITLRYGIGLPDLVAGIAALTLRYWVVTGGCLWLLGRVHSTE